MRKGVVNGKINANREESRQKGHDGSRKTCVARGRKISFLEGGGINVGFGPKYRPLVLSK